MWLICLLHTNQLPWRHFFTNLDRRTGGKDIVFQVQVRVELLVLIYSLS